MKNLYAFFILTLSFIKTAESKTWQTATFGYWHSTAVWMGGIIPPCASSDTFIIKHPVVLDSTITLNPGAFLQIDSAGGICGHHTMVVHTNATVITNDILELDILDIPGGVVSCQSNSIVILANFATLSGGGSMTVNGLLSVGPWFNCHLPEYTFLTHVSKAIVPERISVFPNPSNGTFIFTSPFPMESIRLVDLAGRIVYLNEKIKSNAYSCKLTMPKGIYGAEIVVEGKVYREKVVID